LGHGIEKQAQCFVVHSGNVFGKENCGLPCNTIGGPLFNQERDILDPEVLGGKDSGVVFNFPLEEEFVVWVGD